LSETHKIIGCAHYGPPGAVQKQNIDKINRIHMIYSTFGGLCFIIFIPPGPLPARRAYRPEGRPLWAGLRLGEASLRLRERPENDEEKI